MKTMIGLEIHCQMKTQSKMFCECSTDYRDKKPNSVTCPLCVGFPGPKPKVNKKALDFGMLVAQALNCKVADEMYFSRKSYFYPDLVKNFQISQYDIPLATGGFLELNGKKIGIRRVHLEEDPGKLLHISGNINTAKYVLIDYNRSGIPLCEIVTEPDFKTPKEVRLFLNKLSTILEYLGVYDPALEGSMRVDVNISIGGGERVEIKNMTGFQMIEKALNFEILRQKNIVRSGGKIEQETRAFDADKAITRTLRTKETEEDYGYIFEPDLTRIEISNVWKKQIKKQQPELPDERIVRLVKDYKIDEYQARVIIYTDKPLADFFEDCCKLFKKPQQIAKWIVADLLKCLNWHGISIRESKVTPKTFVELLKLIDKGKVTERLAKELIKDYVDTGKSPKQIIKEKGLELISRDEVKKVIERVIKKNQQAWKDYKSGKKKALEFIIGQVLRETKAKADPKVVRELIKKIK